MSDFVPVDEWTDDEWERVMEEFTSLTHALVVGEAVYRWRQEASE